MAYSIQNRYGEIIISDEIIIDTVGNVAKSLSYFPILSVTMDKKINGLYTFLIHMENISKSINIINYINDFQQKLKKMLNVCLNISSYFSIVILN